MTPFLHCYGNAHFKAFYCNKLSHPSRCMSHLPKRFLAFDGELQYFLFGFGWGLRAFLQGPLMCTSHVSPACKPGVLKLTCMSPTWLRRVPRSRAVCWNCTSFTRLSLIVWPYGSLTPQPVSTAWIYQTPDIMGIYTTVQKWGFSNIFYFFSFVKKLILLLSKGTLNWSKVRKTFTLLFMFQLNAVLLKFLITVSTKISSTTTVFNIYYSNECFLSTI